MQLSHLILLIIPLFITSFSSSSTAEILSSFSVSNSPWHPSQNRTLVSPNSTFTAGFHPSPTSPNLFFFSIWYSNLSEHPIIWFANRTSPVHKSASLIITPKDGLQLINGSSGPNLWPSPAPLNSSSPRLLLQDDGNLVFGMWESFQHPTDTIVPTQEIQNGTVLGSQNGKYTFSGSKNLFFNGSDNYWSSSNGLVSLGEKGHLVQDNGGSIIFSDFNQIRTRRLTLDNDGNLRVWSFEPVKGTWIVVWRAIQEICQVHGLCGPGSICYSDGSTESGYECMCPPGFKWVGSGSCTRKTPIQDLGKTKFLPLDYVKYSSRWEDTDLKTRNFTQCESNCLVNPNCVGFRFKYDGKGYCVLQLDRLSNGYWSPGTEAVFYLRVDESEPDPSNFTGISKVLTTTCSAQLSLPDPPDESDETTLNIVIISALFTVEIASGVILLWAFLKRYVKYRDMARTLGLGLGLLPTPGPKRFSYAEMRAATKDFSNDNIIGKGGFSDVYMGKLQDGRPVAVKCLKNAKGGDAEFWAEVTIIARMHHLNLVRLWGFCNEKGRKILVYEHVPNGSLDKYLFVPGRIGPDDSQNDDEMGLQQKPILDWNIRYRIALGVARAIAYLHEECLEWVLHCDIKPDNILLGDDFCPKVSDFGLSKLRKKEQSVTMSQIRGTRGYLAPEWAKNDPITSKVDVYSFGMVLLEIVTGVRNMATEPSNSIVASEEWYFPRWAFEMAIEKGKIDEILDAQIMQSYDSRVHMRMVDRMVKTAMWCIQARPEMRPSMGKVAKMLEGTVEILEPPKPTIFFLGEDE